MEGFIINFKVNNDILNLTLDSSDQDLYDKLKSKYVHTCLILVFEVILV